MRLNFMALVFLAGALSARGQGTFAWDQQATNFVDGTIFLTNQPMGQPFTPSQAGMDVVALNLGSLFVASGDVEVNVRSDSITGAILGTSDAVTFSDSGVYYFLFSDPITLNPGTTYYLQPIAISGSGVGANIIDAPGSSGSAIYGGVTHTVFNFWYQEGNVVPEPSITSLFAIGGLVAF